MNAPPTPREGWGPTVEPVTRALRALMTLPLLPRAAVMGAAFAGIAGGIAGLVVGLLTNPPTAPFAVVELGLPAAVVGALGGLATGLVVFALRRITPTEAGAAEISQQPLQADVWVPWLLVFGSFVFWVGWFAGLYLLWSSATWRLRDKLLGTLLTPGGLALPIVLLGDLPTASSTACTGSGGPGRPTVTHCTTGGSVLPLPAGIALLVVSLVVPLVVAVHVARARRASLSSH